MEDRKLKTDILHSPFSILHPRSSILHPPSSILYPLSSLLDPLSSILYLLLVLLVLTTGCQSPPASKPAETSGPLNYTAYLYSLYDTEWASRPKESLKEDRLELKPGAALVVARLGEYAPREALLEQLRAQTNLFSRVAGIPAVLELPAAAQGQPPPRLSQEAIKDHLVKMRHLAADIGADYLYLVGGAPQTHSAQNPSGVLDLTFIGQFIVPSHRIEVQLRGSGALVDVATGRVLSVVTEESKQITYAPTGMLEDRKRRDTQKADAVLEERLTQKLVGQLESRK